MKKIESEIFDGATTTRDHLTESLIRPYKSNVTSGFARSSVLLTGRIIINLIHIYTYIYIQYILIRYEFICLFYY